MLNSTACVGISISAPQNVAKIVFRTRIDHPVFELHEKTHETLNQIRDICIFN
jgi:hypothetical protein